MAEALHLAAAVELAVRPNGGGWAQTKRCSGKPTPRVTLHENFSSSRSNLGESIFAARCNGQRWPALLEASQSSV